MKNVIYNLLVLVLLLGCKQNQNNSVKIGAVLPLTGSYAQYGMYMKQGIEIALEDAIKSGIIKRSEVSFIYEDSKAESKTSINAFNKLIEIDKVIACIPATSAVTLAMKPIANKNEIVLINATAISPEIEDTSDYIFSIIPNAIYEGEYLANYAFKNLHKRTAAIIYRNDPSGIGFKESISKEFYSIGGKIAYMGAQQPNDNNFKSQLLKLKEISQIDVIFVMLFGPEVANFAKQAKESGLEKQIITYETFNSPTAISIAGNSANGIVFCSPKFDKDSKDVRSVLLRNRLKEKYNQVEFNYFIAAHYDAAMILIEGVAKGSRTGKVLRDYMGHLKQFQGVTGLIKFNSNGSAEVPLVIYKVNDAKFTLYN